MIKPLVIPEILVDVYYQNVYHFTVNQFTHLDIRKQISEKNLEGYSLKINPQFHNLFDVEHDIANHIVKIDKNGEIDNWFPEYNINEEYTDVPVYSEILCAVIKIRHSQKQKDE